MTGICGEAERSSADGSLHRRRELATSSPMAAPAAEQSLERQRLLQTRSGRSDSTIERPLTNR